MWAGELKGEQQLSVLLNDITVITKEGMVKSRGGIEEDGGRRWNSPH